MKNYTIYRDEVGKYFAKFDDEPRAFKNARGELTAVRHFKGTLSNMLESRNEAIVKEW